MKSFIQRHHDMYARLKDCGFNSPEQNKKTIEIVAALVQKRLETIRIKETPRKAASPVGQRAQPQRMALAA
jgi:hypothetical protein